MDGLTLLANARSAGLVVEVQGRDLRIKGPKQAEGIARELIQHKAIVLAALSSPVVASPKAQHLTRDNPARVTLDGKNYAVAPNLGMWFFCLVPEAGWTACSTEFAEIIEDQLEI